MDKVYNATGYIKENCVSFETAKELKDIYKSYTSHSYIKEECVKDEYKDEFGSYYPYEIQDEFPDKYKEIVEDIWFYNDFSYSNDERLTGALSAPNLFDVVTYIVDKYKVYIGLIYKHNKWSWYSQCLDKLENAMYYSEDEYSSMQEALDMGIRVTIKDIK